MILDDDDDDDIEKKRIRRIHLGSRCSGAKTSTSRQLHQIEEYKPPSRISIHYTVLSCAGDDPDDDDGDETDDDDK